MNKTPLFASHQHRGATLEILGVQVNASAAAGAASTESWLLPERFGDVEAEVDAVRRGAGIVDLAHLGTANLVGPDARRFCNGMFTNNVRRLQPGQGNRNCMCDDRGRIQGLLDLYCTDDDAFQVVLEGVAPAWFEQRYQMYIVFDDVELTVSAGEPWVLSVQGPDAADVLGRLGLPVPEGDHDHVVVPGAEGPGLRVARKDRTGLGGFDLLVPDAVVAETWEAALHAGAMPFGHAALDALRIAAGRARWPDEQAGRYPHELRIETETCSFDKGCYVGQEVLNRIDVKGTVNRRLFGLVMDEDALPPAGAVVAAETDLGVVTSSARVDGRPLALAILKKPGWEPGLRVQVRAGVTVGATVSDLPF